MNQQLVRIAASLSQRLLTLGFLLFFVLCGSVSNIFAETDLPHPTFTWDLSPMDNNWNNAANWMPTGIPDTTSEAAEFGSSAITNIAATATVHSIEFKPGASQYTMTGNLIFHAGGVINNSGVEQTFNGTFRFEKFGATAGSLVTFTNNSRSVFSKGTSAGSATYINNDEIQFFGGYRSVWHTTAGEATIINNGFIYIHKADAGSATFINNGGTTFGAEGAVIGFTVGSSAFSSTITNNGGAVFGGHGSRLIFRRSASAGSATLIANGGAGPGSGATILFMSGSSGDLARVEVFGNGNLDVSRPEPISDTVGSIEGNGLVFLGSSQLSVGNNNLDTTFAGTISDEGGVQQGSGGAFGKTGTGTLSLTNANTYTGGTSLDDGSLFVNNISGSGTGTGAVQANAGTLGGAGIISGPVTIGTGAGSGAVLSPGVGANVIGVFTLLDTLTLHSDSTSEVQLNSTTLTADSVIAQGVTIDSGAEIAVTDLGSSTLPVGTSFVLIDNTAATAIAGAFTNLPDGGTLTVGSNTFAADYQGGDGNDLTLTVIP